jgi:uncharacterized surface protein with fasciclin (FAS1) repeats
MGHLRYGSLAVAGLSVVATVGMSACSSHNTGASTPTSSTGAMSSEAPMMTTSTQANPAAGLVGSGCKSYEAKVPTGPGSISGMAQDPVAVAASNNPMLTTLTSAVSGKLNPNVNLVDTLNKGQYTVFAPTDEAFAKLPQATVDSLKTDSAKLNSILTYHVVQGQISPNKVDGMHPTLQGAAVNVMGTGNDIKVNDAGLVCGGVHTANATVYMIDTVLMPPGA